MKLLKEKNICELVGETIYDLLYWATILAGNLYNVSRKDESFLQKNKPNFEKALSILEKGLAIKEVHDKNHMIARLNSLKKEMLNTMISEQAIHSEHK